jgi:hypothetical protein
MKDMGGASKSKEQQLDPRRLPIAKIDLPASTSYLRRILRTERYRMTCSGFVFGGKDLSSRPIGSDLLYFVGFCFVDDERSMYRVPTDGRR